MTDLTKLDHSAIEVDGDAFVKPDPPPQVEGRVLHIDADFFAYQAGYRYEDETREQSIETLRIMIQSYRIMAGAQSAVLHLTMGDKGGRYEIARVKEYQAHRSEKPEGLVQRVAELRDWMANCSEPNVVPQAWIDQEADDGLAQAMHTARIEDKANLHVMWSADKDLYMVGGLHLDSETYEIVEYPWGFGKCYLDDSGSQKKVKGQGTSFFWHQLIMGDGADNIPGLPEFTANICMQCWPTKALLNAFERRKKAKTTKQRASARAACEREMSKVKPKSAGAVRAFEYLRGCNTDLEAFRRVRDAYAEYYGPGAFDFQCWDGKTERLTAGDMLLEQARLLWMRRTKGEDVLDWLKEIAQ